jgi:hypothetical protein
MTLLHLVKKRTTEGGVLYHSAVISELPNARVHQPGQVITDLNNSN